MQVYTQGYIIVCCNLYMVASRYLNYNCNCIHTRNVYFLPGPRGQKWWGERWAASHKRSPSHGTFHTSSMFTLRDQGHEWSRDVLAGYHYIICGEKALDLRAHVDGWISFVADGWWLPIVSLRYTRPWWPTVDLVSHFLTLSISLHNILISSHNLQTTKFNSI